MKEATALAEAMRDAARTHKRSANAHRRSARLLMQALEDLEHECARLGITIDIQSRDRGGHSQHARPTT